MIVEHLTAPFILFNTITYGFLLVAENYRIIKTWLRGKLGEKHPKKFISSVVQLSLVFYLF